MDEVADGESTPNDDVVKCLVLRLRTMVAGVQHNAFPWPTISSPCFGGIGENKDGDLELLLAVGDQIEQRCSICMVYTRPYLACRPCRG